MLLLLSLAEAAPQARTWLTGSWGEIPGGNLNPVPLHAMHSSSGLGSTKRVENHRSEATTVLLRKKEEEQQDQQRRQRLGEQTRSIKSALGTLHWNNTIPRRRWSFPSVREYCCLLLLMLTGWLPRLKTGLVGLLYVNSLCVPLACTAWVFSGTDFTGDCFHPRTLSYLAIPLKNSTAF